MVPRPTQSLSLSEKQYHVPRRAGKKLSIFFSNAAYRITRDQPASARDVTSRSARPWSSAQPLRGAEFEARLHIWVQKGMEIA
jgi:hypothetical protein